MNYFYKTLYITLTFTFLTTISFTQTATVLDGSTDGYDQLMDPDYNYSVSQNIYPADLLVGLSSNTISGLEFEWDGTGPQVFNVEIYLASTPKEEVVNQYDWLPINEFTLVYSGPINASGTWVPVTFSTNFTHNMGENLCLMVHNVSGNNCGMFCSSHFIVGSSPNYQTIWASQDARSYDLNDLPNIWGTWSTKKLPSLKLTTSSSCVEFTAGGSISGAQTTCGTYDPANITSSSLPSGGSGGTTTYQWQSSPNNSSWSNISGANATTHDPGVISSTTYYRRGAYRCSAGGTKYSSSIAKTVSSYTITYNSNGGSGSTNSTVGCPNLTVAANGFTNSGYSFNGWNTASNGSGTPYAAGATYSTSSDVTLYAQWSAAAATTTGSGGNWSDGATWSTGAAPLAGVSVTIDDDIFIDVNTNTVGNLTINSDVTINSSKELNVSGTTTIAANTILTINGTYDADGTFDASASNAEVRMGSAGVLKLSGAITSLGALDVAEGTVELDGSSTQSLPAENFYSLKVNNSSGVTLAGNVTVNGTLTMTSGDITSSNSNKLTIKSSVSGGSSGSHIVGPVDYYSNNTNEVSIPVGTGSAYTPIKIDAETSSATTFTAEYKTGSPGTIDWANNASGTPINGSNVAHVNNNYYIEIDRSGSANAYITLDFSGFSSIPSSSDQYLMHWDGSEWDEMAVVSRSGNSVKSLATSFSPFGQGSGGDALPIDLVSFDGSCEQNEVEINFVIAAQINNDYFSILRSDNNKDWNLIGEIAGAGNTNTQISYQFNDVNPIAGTSYYQLSQTDFDGKSTSFSPISITCEQSIIGDYSVYPNPANEVLMIDIDLETYQGDNITLELFDVKGALVNLQSVQLNRGYNHLEVDLSKVPEGIYLLKFNGTKNYMKQTRIVKR